MVIRLVSVLGLAAMIGLAWALSEDRRRVNWRLTAWGLALQLTVGLLVLRSPAGRGFFEWVKRGFDVLTQSSHQGAQFLFGNLTTFFVLNQDAVAGAGQPFVINAVVAFQVLPVIIFVSALSGLLFHLRVIQALVKAMTWVMRRTLKTSGAETFGTALLVFTGIESVAAIQGYLRTMTRSELCTIMTAFMSTIAASVMVAYASFGAQPGHLLAASLMSAPAAILISKLLIPETNAPATCGEVKIDLPVESANVVDAVARGAHNGLTMALNVGAMLIAFIGLVYLLNVALQAAAGVDFTCLMGWFFRPFAWLMGVPGKDVPAVAELLATKTVLNEFLAYADLKPLIADNALDKRSVTIATYALCGFANPGSMGIMIGALSGLMPERRGEVAQLAVKSLIAGTLACFMTACVAGMLTDA